MTYKLQREAIKVCRKDFLDFRLNDLNFYFLLLGDAAASYNFQDSKEKARLEFYFDLLDKYKYPIGQIEFDAAVPSGCYGRVADIAVFKDSERKNPYIVVDCHRDRISESAFETGVKAVISKAEALGADYAVCITRLKKRVVKLTHSKGAIYAKTVYDLPVLYGAGE